ncbi:uncharacterized protein DUF4402 [Sinobacterium caligoides]|uniref:Uncharacterized protein DUF4402 n=1 Tax=Sinobacterium caligoides TaxID=933926 RepID=A0A3N2DQH3_9GAMM|nr:DUF4402 domain-containing protein [Sinobacterium caligoides]ROS02027.1 uncharacterized protein DUF4402 [Sinobacterium caligoides]
MKKINKAIFAGSAILASLVAFNANAVDEAFKANIELLSSITISEVQGLTFPAQVAGTAATVTVATSDAGAATFNITGIINAPVVASVSEASINMTDSVSGDEILVDAFTVDAGASALDASGVLNGIKVGATAHVDAADSQGSYEGDATFTVVYL